MGRSVVHVKGILQHDFFLCFLQNDEDKDKENKEEEHKTETDEKVGNKHVACWEIFHAFLSSADFFQN